MYKPHRLLILNICIISGVRDKMERCTIIQNAFELADLKNTTLIKHDYR